MAIFIAFSIFASILLNNFFIKKESVVVKWILILNIPLSLYLIVQTGSRKGLVLGISFLFLFFLPFIKSVKGIIAAFSLSFFLFFGFIYLSENSEFAEQLEFVLKRFESAQETVEGTGYEGSAETRLHYISLGIDIWKDNPVLGVGFNNFRVFSGRQYSHNNFVELLSTLGIVGFILFYLFYLFTLLNVLKIKERDLRISAIFFIIVFVVMDYAWVSYYTIPYLMMWVMLSSLGLKEYDKIMEKNK